MISRSDCPQYVSHSGGLNELNGLVTTASSLSQLHTTVFTRIWREHLLHMKYTLRAGWMKYAIHITTFCDLGELLELLEPRIFLYMQIHQKDASISPHSVNICFSFHLFFAICIKAIG